MRIAVIDDWQGIARRSADWGPVEEHAEVSFISEPFESIEQAVGELREFEGIVPLRDRTRFPRELVEQLPNLRVIAQTGMHAIHIDLDACADNGVTVLGSAWGNVTTAATPELCLGLILASSHRIIDGHQNMRAGRWQQDIPFGEALDGKTIGLIGVGVVGSQVAKFANALHMNVLAWSPNLTAERANAVGATFVTKDDLIRHSDIVSLHLIASESTRGIFGAAEFQAMRDGALFVNTARAELVDQDAMMEAIRSERISAALDVFDQEPLPADHPLRSAPNVLMTPHLGFIKRDRMEALYGGAASELAQWLRGEPALVLGGAPAPASNA